MTDAADIESLLELAYTTLEFSPGAEPDWERFATVFDSHAVLALRVFPSDPDVSVMSLAEYTREQMRNDLSDQGYSETPGALSVEVVGDVAMARQEFTMNFARGSVDAVDLFSLARVAGAWRVVAVVSDMMDDATHAADS